MRLIWLALFSLESLAAPATFGEKFIEIRSICNEHRLASVCSRDSYLSDLIASGFFVSEDFNNFAESSLLEADTLKQGAKHPPNYFFQKAKELIERYPGKLEGFFAREALLANRCSEIQSLAESRTGTKSDKLILAYAACFERQGHPLKGVGVIEKSRLKSPMLAYHAARMLATKNPTKADKIVARCQIDHPLYYPCYELRYQLGKLTGRHDPLPQMTYRTKAGEIIRTISAEIDALERDVGMSKAHSTKNKILAKIREFETMSPNGLEPMLWRIAITGTATELDHRRARVFAIANLNLTHKLLERVKPIIRESLLATILRHGPDAAPDQPPMWWQLIQFAGNHGDCSGVRDYIAEARQHLKPLPRGIERAEAMCVRQNQRHTGNLKTDTASPRMETSFRANNVSRSGEVKKELLQ